jgi:hypothetical protein
MLTCSLLGMLVGSPASHASDLAAAAERVTLLDAVSTEAGTLVVIGLGLLSLALIRRRVTG